jgi:colanic acid/amylovoran biosynthesis glycosyltransferase
MERMTDRPQAPCALLIHTFPLYSMTCIADEIRGLRRRGLPIVLFAVRAPREGQYPAAMADLRAATRYLLPVGPLAAVRRHLGAGARRPAGYARGLWRAITAGRLSLRHRLRTLVHFGEAVCLQPLLEAAGCRHLHVHALSGGASIALFLRDLGGPGYSLTAHGTDIFVERVLLAEKMRDAAFTRVATAYNRDYLLRLPGSAGARVVVLPFGVDTEALSPAADAPGLGDPGAGALRLVSVGRLVWQKAHHLLLRACAVLRDRGVDLHLTLVGEGEERRAIETLRDRLGLADRVRLAGALSPAGVVEALRAADLFVLSSISEGFGMVLIEAMACGLPVIAPEINGIPEVVAHGEDGLLFQPGSAEALAGAIATLASDPALRRRMGEAGRRKVKAHHQAADRMDRFAQLLRETVASAGPA